MCAKEIVEICGVGDLEHLNENAGHQLGGLIVVGQQPAEDVPGLLPSDPSQDSSFGGAEEHSPLRLELGEGHLDPVGATDEDDARQVG